MPKRLVFLSIAVALLTCPSRSQASMADTVPGCDSLDEETAAPRHAVVTLNAQAVPFLRTEWRRLLRMQANGASLPVQPQSGTASAPDDLASLKALLEPPATPPAVDGAQLFNLAEAFWKVFIAQEKAFGLGAALAERGLEPTPAPLSVLVEGQPADLRDLVFDTLYAVVAPFAANILGSKGPDFAETLARNLVVVEPNFYVSATTDAAGGSRTGAPDQAVPNDPLLHAQWALQRSEVGAAWEAGYKGRCGISVAVIDSGLNQSQADLPRAHFSRRFCSDPQLDCDLQAVTDENGHGTALAGVVGALTNNNFRVAGLNWHVKLLNLRVLNKDNRGTVFDGAKALETAADRGAVVASLAWGGKCPSTALWNAIWYAGSKDVLVVAAAGNEQLDLCWWPEFFPAAFRHSQYRCADGDCLDNLLVVGATDLTRDPQGCGRDKTAPSSNYCPEIVQLGAPGVGITTTGLDAKDGGILDATGTSMATALVAGAAALVACEFPETGTGPRYQWILDRLLGGADRVCELKDYFEEGRRLNVLHAVEGTPPASPDCSNSPPPC